MREVSIDNQFKIKITNNPKLTTKPYTTPYLHQNTIPSPSNTPPETPQNQNPVSKPQQL